ncbi:ATP-binding protein [Actinomadura sp. SCN-SB]|uniref:ATP-binding protein n=1 Tax=Actinomadura sp. SCN-SB TaxID=3373092 RepID=UPI003751D228
MDALRPMRYMPVRLPMRIARRLRRSDERCRRPWRFLRSEVFTVPADPSQLANVRARLRATLGSDHLCADTAESVLSELAANAIVHGCAPGDPVRVTIRVTRRAKVAITVTDTGRGPGTAPRIRFAGTGSTGGRGLFLVASLASRWSVRRAGTGHRVRALLDPRDAESANSASPLWLEDFLEY